MELDVHLIKSKLNLWKKKFNNIENEQRGPWAVSHIKMIKKIAMCFQNYITSQKSYTDILNESILAIQCFKLDSC